MAMAAEQVGHLGEIITALIGSGGWDFVKKFTGGMIGTFGKEGSERIVTRVFNSEPRVNVLRVLSYMERQGYHSDVQILWERMIASITTNFPDIEDEVVAAMANLVVYTRDDQGRAIGIQWEQSREQFIWLANRSHDPQGFKEAINFLKHDPIDQRLDQVRQTVDSKAADLAPKIRTLRHSLHGKWWMR